MPGDGPVVGGRDRAGRPGGRDDGVECVAAGVSHHDAAGSVVEPHDLRQGVE
jgi:hypothetical protein